MDSFKYRYGLVPTKSASGIAVKNDSTTVSKGSQLSTQAMMITTTSSTASVVNCSQLHTPKRSVQNVLRSSTMMLSESHTAPEKASSSYGLHKHDVIPEKIEQMTSSTAKGIEKRNKSEPAVKSQLNASRDSKSCEQVDLVTHDLKPETTFNSKDESNMILHSELLSSHRPEQAHQLRYTNVDKVIATDD